jgi:hypothetical protein
MIINLIYVLTAFIAIYSSIQTYIHTKNKLILIWMIILIASVVIEVRWAYLGSFIIDTTGYFWVAVDIARAVLMIYFSNLTYRTK